MSKTYTRKSLNNELRHCKGGAHEDKQGHHAKRARQAEQFRKEMKNHRFEG